MKSAPFLAGFCAVLGAAALLARADNAPPVNLKSTIPMQAPPPVPASATPVESANAPSPDFSTSDLSTVFPTTDPEEMAERSMAIHDAQAQTPDLKAFDQAQKQQAYDNDWMLRDYTAQLKKHGLANTPETDPSLIPHAADPNAPYVDPLLPGSQATQTSKPVHVHTDAMSDPTSGLTPNSALSPLALQPLLAPLNPGVKHPAPRNAWGSPDPSPVTMDDSSPMNAALNFHTAPTPDLNSNDNSMNSLLDSPGLTAQQQGLTKSADLNLQDPLPEEDPVHVAPHVNRNTDFLVPTVPANDVAEFFKKQAEGLHAPTAPTAAQPLGTTAPLKPLPPIDAPEPFAKPPVSGLRSHVADPFDILNR